MDYILLYFIGMAAMTLGTLAGGGGLITMPAMLLMGIPIHSAIGAAKISNTVSSFTTFITVLLKKQITFKESFWIIPASMVGGFTGGFIATRLTESTMYTVAIILLIFAFFTSFLSKSDFTGTENLRPTKVAVPGLVGVGMYDGMFGPGQGTLLLYLFNHLRISYMRAIGFVRLATFSSGFGAAISYIAMGKIIWPIVFALMAGSISGAQIGVRLAEKLNPKHVKTLLRVVTITLIVQLIINQFI
ncbi:sulfite exporter TauE/SafE family protein [Sporosarcina sp. G11-34]|uniref:sulfite exporter TauE/SafE family protein n=1 Tax=Sporosarcina sp. G11-34 TaxID=2849605 RepID=UPI0022A92953|nr:sulfite exporter TauE/SafE family protein [Sporosarcina sp. G11-34]MCZ2259110.1 sulfite exporter TauE/SafE family protein [Sporosarcina sp. G11-34]